MLDEIERSEERLAGRGGGERLVRMWTPRDARATLLIVHGYAEHGGRYERTGPDLARRGYRTWTIDLRGHGRSTGPRGHVGSFDEYLDDVETLRERAASDAPPGPVFLVGHSMGGLVAILYALERPDGLKALALSSPLLALHPDVDLSGPISWLARAAARVLPRLRVNRALDPSAVSRSAETVAAYAADPLIVRGTTLGWYAALGAALERAWSGAAGLRPPTWLAWAGADRLVDSAAPPRWAADAPAGRVTLSERPGLFHELFNEPERDQVLADLVDWLERT